MITEYCCFCFVLFYSIIISILRWQLHLSTDNSLFLSVYCTRSLLNLLSRTVNKGTLYLIVLFNFSNIMYGNIVCNLQANII